MDLATSSHVAGMMQLGVCVGFLILSGIFMASMVNAKGNDATINGFGVFLFLIGSLVVSYQPEYTSLTADWNPLAIILGYIAIPIITASITHNHINR